MADLRPTPAATAMKDPEQPSEEPSRPSDLARLHAAIAGEPGAFDRLVTAYADRLRSLVRRRLDPALRTRLSADDIVQETLLVASDRVRGLVVSREGDFWAWLCTVAEQRLVDARRRHLLASKRDARRTGSLADTSTDRGRAMSRVCPPSEDARASERAVALERAMESLPPSYREVIRLRVVVGLSTGDAAAVMGRTPGALSVLLCKAVKRLGEALEGGASS
jgi:RNA polymerase sigma-70 factor (ECF subfamily)